MEHNHLPYWYVCKGIVLDDVVQLSSLFSALPSTQGHLLHMKHFVDLEHQPCKGLRRLMWKHLDLTRSDWPMLVGRTMQWYGRIVSLECQHRFLKAF